MGTDDIVMKETEEQQEDKQKMSFCELVHYLLQLSSNTSNNDDDHDNRQQPQSILLALIIMETMPYMRHILPKHELASILSTLDKTLKFYKSGYKPTKGIYA